MSCDATTSSSGKLGAKRIGNMKHSVALCDKTYGKYYLCIYIYMYVCIQRAITRVKKATQCNEQKQIQLTSCLKISSWTVVHVEEKQLKMLKNILAWKVFAEE